jgi:hypothetical protein
VALDGTGRNSPFTEALLKHIPAPGDDLPTILINVRNDVMKATSRRQVPWEHSAMTARFFFIPPVPSKPGPPPGPFLELEFWSSVKDSTSPAVLGTYLEKYPNGEFAPIARALIDHYEKQIKLEQAARERERRQQEEAAKAAAAKRLEEEQRAREAALALERKRAQEAKSDKERARLEEERAALAARSEELRKVLEEVRVAREAAKVAEEQRLAALKAAESATKAAEEAIAKKRSAESGEATRLAAIPSIDVHTWSGKFTSIGVRWRQTAGCRGERRSGTYTMSVSGGKLIGHGGKLSGTISDSGVARWTFPSSVDGVPFRCSVTLREKKGSGTCARTYGHCDMVISVERF